MRSLLVGVALLGLVAPGCGGKSGTGADAAPSEVDSGFPVPADAMPGTGADAALTGLDGGVTPPNYRNSLSVCWTDPSCKRALAIAHGGMWNTSSAPYDSNAAIQAAYAAGYDGVKIDVRITKDGVPVIAHSSPIQTYESLDCAGKKIEDMTADQVTQCHRFPSTTQTFQRLDDVLSYLRGKMVAQLTVKLPGDYAATIANVLQMKAQDFAFFEVTTSDLQTTIPMISGSDSVWYLICIGSNYSDIDTLLSINNPRAFMYELAPSTQIPNLVSTKLHPNGIRVFTYDKNEFASVSELEAFYKEGFDVVSSQSGNNGLTARIDVNTANGISPP